MIYENEVIDLSETHVFENANANAVLHVIKGSKAVYNVAPWTEWLKTVTAQYTRKQFTVRFLDGFDNNALIDEQQVEWGLSAEAPEAPVHAGYYFTGWDVESDIVMDNLDVVAQYAEGTGIADITVDDEGTTVKVLQNGQLYILRDGKVYNATGAEVK